MVSHCQATRSSFRWNHWLNLTLKILLDQLCTIHSCMNIASASWRKSAKSGDRSYSPSGLISSSIVCRDGGRYGNVCSWLVVCIRTKSINCVISLSRDCGAANKVCEDQSSIMYAWGRNAPSTKLPRGNYSLSLSEIYFL